MHLTGFDETFMFENPGIETFSKIVLGTLYV